MVGKFHRRYNVIKSTRLEGANEKWEEMDKIVKNIEVVEKGKDGEEHWSRGERKIC